MILDRLHQKNLIHPPKWLPNNTQYLTVMGSAAYGVSTDQSDLDVYGFTIPHKDMVFPHTAGKIEGFGHQIEKFQVWQEHHVKDPSRPETVYDFCVYSIVRYFQLCMGNNPNMIDSLFVPRRCVIHSTYLGEHVREKRKMFLHKGAWHRFKGYAYAQMSKIITKAEAMNRTSYDFKQLELFPITSKSSDTMANIIDFENQHQISRTTKFQDVHDEMKRRGIF